MKIRYIYKSKTETKTIDIPIEEVERGKKLAFENTLNVNFKLVLRIVIYDME